MKENGYGGSVFITKLGLKILYSSLCLVSNKVIVHEFKLKEYLKDYWVNTKKVFVIHHGINKINLVDKEIAKSKLKLNNKYTFLYFGYVTGYKGIELIINALKKIKDEDFNFIIVGSEHPRLKDEENYKKYYGDIKKFFDNDKRCKFTGYVPENEVNSYFRASDCVVLPYTVQMSSSGPMAIAIANELLILGSDSFEGVLPNNLLFRRDEKDLIRIMEEAKSGELNMMLPTIKKIKKDLLWKNIAKDTLEVWRR